MMSPEEEDDFDADDESFLQAALSEEQTWVAEQNKPSRNSASVNQQSPASLGTDLGNKNSLNNIPTSFSTPQAPKGHHLVSGVSKSGVKKFTFKSKASPNVCNITSSGSPVNCSDSVVTSPTEIPSSSSRADHSTKIPSQSKPPGCLNPQMRNQPCSKDGANNSKVSPACSVQKDVISTCGIDSEHVPDNSKDQRDKNPVFVADNVRNLFEISGDGWDSDLDLSGLDCDGTPAWKPGPSRTSPSKENTTAIPTLKPSGTTPVSHKQDRCRSFDSNSRKTDQSTSIKQTEITKSTLPFDASRNECNINNVESNTSKSNLDVEDESFQSTPICSTNDESMQPPSNFKTPCGSSRDRFNFATNQKQTVLGVPESPGIHNNSSISSLRKPSNITTTDSGSSFQLRPSNVFRNDTPVSRLSAPSTSRFTPVTNLNTANSAALVTPIIPKLATPNLKECTTPSVAPSILDTPSSSKASLSSSSRRKRKFPGPAGVLPKLKSNISLAEVDAYKPAYPRTSSASKQQNMTAASPSTSAPTESQVPASQSIDERFADHAPWQRMVDDLEPQAQKILQEYSIGEILAKASKRQLPRSKVPVLCAALDQVCVQTAEASAVFRDKTGVMKGTIHRHVVKEYPEAMQAGTVMVLRQVGVFSPSGRNFYLNITPNNLVRIYSRGALSQEISAQTVASFSPEDFKNPDPGLSTSRLRSPRPGIHRPNSPLLGPSTPAIRSSTRLSYQSPGISGSFTPRLTVPGRYGAPFSAISRPSPGASRQFCSPGTFRGPVNQRFNSGPIRPPVQGAGAGALGNGKRLVYNTPTRLSSNSATPQHGNMDNTNINSSRPQLRNMTSSCNNGAMSSQNARFTFKNTNTPNRCTTDTSSSPKTASVAPPCDSRTALGTDRIAGNTVMTTVDNLWQDDQLDDDLLSELGDPF